MFSREMIHVYQSLKQSLSFCSHRAYSTVSIGKHFEKASVFALTHLSFDLSVCGGPKDRGVDFRGKWRLKNSCVPVVGQCRKYKKRLGPRHVRELEGVLGRESDGTLGILVSSQGYTKDAYNTCMGSSHSLALTVLQGTIDGDLELGSIEALSDVERTYTVNGYTIEGLDATDGDETLSRGTLEPIHQSQEFLRELGADNADWNKNFIMNGQITLFELNPAARKLLPQVFVGITFKGKHTRNPEIVFVEDDSILHVKTGNK